MVSKHTPAISGYFLLKFLKSCTRFFMPPSLSSLSSLPSEITVTVSPDTAAISPSTIYISALFLMSAFSMNLKLFLSDISRHSCIPELSGFSPIFSISLKNSSRVIRRANSASFRGFILYCEISVFIGASRHMVPSSRLKYALSRPASSFLRTLSLISSVSRLS